MNVLTVAYVFLLGLFGANFITDVRGWGNGVPPNLETSPAAVQALFARFDSGYYLRIARVGYSAEGNERAFFPLYPLLVDGLTAISGLSLLWSGLLISLAAFLASSLFLYKWVLHDNGRDVARLAVICLCAFPLSFFFVAFYAESIFLLCSIAGVYFARKDRFAMSGVAIALAGAARPQAFLLGLPLALEYLRYRRGGGRELLGIVLGVLVAPLGSIGYLGWLLIGPASGTDYYSGVLLGWPTEFTTWPWVTLIDALTGAVFGTGVAADWFSRVLVWHDLLFVVAAAALCVWAFRRMPLSTAAFLLVGVIVMLTHHGPHGYALESVTRHIAAHFPIFLALALLLRRLPARFRWAVLGASFVWLGVLSAWFASGRWVA